MSAIVLQGDARALPLPDESIDLVCTSPPYFGQRDYRDGGESLEGQIGSEETPAEYIANLIAVTQECARVLKPSGSIFFNLGDKYSTYTGAKWGQGRSLDGLRGQAKVPHGGPVNAPRIYGIPNKSLMGLPWRFALACIDELGLILRRDIIWSKRSALPESARDRIPTRHEYLFHLVKQPRYFSAMDEIRSPVTMDAHTLSRRQRTDRRLDAAGAGQTSGASPLGAPPGSVWEFASQPLVAPGWLDIEHHAAFPFELPRRCILGWSPPGICTACGQGRRPVATAESAQAATWALAQRNGRSWHGDGPNATRALGIPAADRQRTITGYACACPAPDASTRPATVVDPFCGTGTSMLVASAYGRIGIGVDRSADYCRLAQWRCSDPGEIARALKVDKPPKQVDGQQSLFEEWSA